MQSLVYPIRYGISGGENIKGVFIPCEGGLDLTQSIIENRSGCCTQLINFEAALKGGYRRINGFQKLTTAPVTGQGSIIGTAVYFPGQILAARAISQFQYSWYQWLGSTWSSPINSTLLNTTANTLVNTHQWNWNGTYKIIFTDGVNNAAVYNGSAWVNVTDPNAPQNPAFACAFAGYMFLAGFSSNPGAVAISAPLNEFDWNPLDGAATVVVGDTITWLATWRNQLIIFCKNSIYKITGTSTNLLSSTPFQLQQITDRTGCIEGRTVQEIDGDLIYLSQDGIRTIAGTFNIGDTEIGTISRPIQQIIYNITSTGTNIHSLVVHKKTQYRLFYSINGIPYGIIGAIRRFRDGSEGWEWGELRNILPSCCTSGFLATDNQEYVIHGGFNGIVYRQEQGIDFDGSAIGEVYTSVPLECGDYAIRKAFKKIKVLAFVEGGTGNPFINLNLTYDYGKQGLIQPPTYILNNNSISTVYDIGQKYDQQVKYDIPSDPTYYQQIQGSSFVVQLSITTPISTIIQAHPSYIIQGFNLEFFPAGRR